MIDEFAEAMVSGGTDQCWICPDCSTENVSDFATDDNLTCEKCGNSHSWSLISQDKLDFLEAQLLLDSRVEGVM
jgi:hypothetical protein